MNSEAIDFEGWVKYLFDRPVTDPAWYWDDEGGISLPPEKFIAYGTRLFSEAGDLLAAYSDGQVNDGLHRVISNSVSDEIFALKDSGIPLRERVDFLRGIFSLNRQCFNARCTPHLSHLDREATPAHVSPLNGICYMWWDIFILYGNREDVNLDPLNRACIDVMA